MASYTGADLCSAAGLDGGYSCGVCDEQIGSKEAYGMLLTCSVRMHLECIKPFVQACSYCPKCRTLYDHADMNSFKAELPIEQCPLRKDQEELGSQDIRSLIAETVQAILNLRVQGIEK